MKSAIGADVNGDAAAVALRQGSLASHPKRAPARIKEKEIPVECRRPGLLHGGTSFSRMLCVKRCYCSRNFEFLIPIF